MFRPQGEDMSILERQAAGARALLTALAQLTQLKSLDLSNIYLTAIHDYHVSTHDMHDLFFMPMMSITSHHLRPFSALTASSHLQRLSLSYWDSVMKVQPLPRITFRERLLRPGRPLLGLTELVVDALDPEILDDLAGIDDDAIDKRFAAFWFLEPWDINVIAVSCPNLKHLTLNCVLSGCAEDSEEALKGLVMLQERLQLQTLCLGGPWICNEDAAVLGTMTSVTALELHNAPWLRSKGLQRLVSLRQLRRLELHCIGHRRRTDLCLVTSQNVSVQAELLSYFDHCTILMHCSCAAGMPAGGAGERYCCHGGVSLRAWTITCNQPSHTLLNTAPSSQPTGDSV